MSMTFFNYGVPLIALAMGGCGVLIVREMSRRFDRQMERIAAEKRRHPAE